MDERVKALWDKEFDKLETATRNAVGTTREFTTKSFFDGFCYALAILNREERILGSQPRQDQSSNSTG